MTKSTVKSRFPIPLSIQDLEQEPYELLPYPIEFPSESDEATRAEAFCSLVRGLESSNRTLLNADISLFQSADSDFEDEEEAGNQSESDLWMDEERMQALYTLVR